MIFVTGDTHGEVDITHIGNKAWPEQKSLTKDDILIIAGDFGFVWKNDRCDLYWRKWLDNRRFTTLFIDGNHENFDLLEEFPVVEKFDAKLQQISKHVFHVCRGEVLNINGTKIWCMGGAKSHDKAYRKEHISWWPQETPTDEEMQHAYANLLKNDLHVDFIITHCTASSVQNLIDLHYEHTLFTDFLDKVDSSVTFKHWYFGHYHRDVKLTSQYTCVYKDVIQIA